MPEIHRSVMYNLTKELSDKHGKHGYKKWTKSAIELIHDISEDYLIEFFEKAHQYTKNRNSKTLQKKDVQSTIKRHQMDTCYCVVEK